MWRCGRTWMSLMLFLTCGRCSAASAASPPAHTHAHDDTHDAHGGDSWNAGMIEVNRTAHSQMFYWYWPPQNGNRSAPLVLWLQGGPGASGLVGMLYEIGPYQLKELRETNTFELVQRQATWTREMGVIFVDNPVGTGYSTPGSLDGYSTTEEQVSANLYRFLQSFYRLYPGTSDCPLYIVGESYGGHYAPNLAVHVMRKNDDLPPQHTNEDVRVPLAGMAIQDGITDPQVQEVLKPAAAYAFGLLDAQQLVKAQGMARKAVALSRVGKFEEARSSRLQMEAYIKNCSGINLLDVREFGDFGIDETIERWANDADVKAQLHVPSGVRFDGKNEQVAKALAGDLMRSYTKEVATLLDTYHIPVLLFQGQFDVKDGSVGNRAWIRRLRWTGQKEFLNAPTVRWYVDDDLQDPAGWAQQSPDKRLTEAVVAGAGHLGPMTQPERILDLMTRWTQGRGFVPPPPPPPPPPPSSSSPPPASSSPSSSPPSSSSPPPSSSPTSSPSQSSPSSSSSSSSPSEQGHPLVTDSARTAAQ